jgi:hypothetical protein
VCAQTLDLVEVFVVVVVVVVVCVCVYEDDISRLLRVHHRFVQRDHRSARCHLNFLSV